MAAGVEPFIDRLTFEGMFRPLSVAEQTLAEMLLPAAAMVINQRVAAAGMAPLDIDNPMAKLVTFEVVRDVFPTVPAMAGHIQYSVSTDDRIQSGTLPEAAGLLDFNDRHWTLLGISANPGPVFGGMGGDFGDPFRASGSAAFCDWPT